MRQKAALKIPEGPARPDRARGERGGICINHSAVFCKGLQQGDANGGVSILVAFTTEFVQL